MIEPIILRLTKRQFRVYVIQDGVAEAIGYVVGGDGRFTITIACWDEQEMARHDVVEGVFSTVIAAAEAIAAAKIGR